MKFWLMLVLFSCVAIVQSESTNEEPIETNDYPNESDSLVKNDSEEVIAVDEVADTAADEENQSSEDDIKETEEVYDIADEEKQSSEDNIEEIEEAQDETDEEYQSSKDDIDESAEFAGLNDTPDDEGDELDDEIWTKIFDERKKDERILADPSSRRRRKPVMDNKRKDVNEPDEEFLEEVRKDLEVEEATQETWNAGLADPSSRRRRKPVMKKRKDVKEQDGDLLQAVRTELEDETQNF